MLVFTALMNLLLAMFCLDLCRGTVFHHLAVRCFYFAAPFLLNILKTIHHQLNLVLDNAPEPFALYVNEHRTATLGISFYIIFTLISKVLTFLLRPMLEGLFGKQEVVCKKCRSSNH